MDNLEPITRNEMFLNGDDLEPITREEMILAGADLEPITRHEWFLKKYRGGGGGGGYDLVNVPNLPADIASFTDGTDLPMASLKVAVTPYQDLHGYDAPWVGGAGKNKLPMTVEGIKAVNTYHSWSGNSTTINNVTITIETDENNNVTGIKFNGTASADITFNLASNISVSNGSYIWSNDQTVNISNLWLSLTSPNIAITLSTQKEVNVTVSSDSIGSAYIYASSGNVFNNIVFKPMIRLASVADATFAPYSNICPIIGWDEAVVSVSGINVWDEEWEVGTINDTTGQDAPENGIIRSKGYIAVKSGIQYYIKKPTNSDIYQIFLYRSDKTFMYAVLVSNIINRVYTIPSGCSFIRFRCLAAYGNTYNNDISINYPSTDTSYHAYNGATYTIDLDGTRYGGTLDVTSGTMTLTHGFSELSEDWAWNRSSSYQGSYYIDKSSTLGYKTFTPFICSHAGCANTEYDYNYGECLCQTSISFWLMGASSSIQDWKNYIAEQKQNGTPITIRYELATPITVQLTPTAVKSLEGKNNIFANCGQITEVKYFKKA